MNTVLHYRCAVLSRTGQPMAKELLQPDFWDAQCLFWGWPIDAPNTLPLGSRFDNTSFGAHQWTSDCDFVMRPGT